MAKVKIEDKKKEPKKATLAERWEADEVPFRVFRNGKWVNAGDLKEEKDG